MAAQLDHVDMEDVETIMEYAERGRSWSHIERTESSGATNVDTRVNCHLRQQTPPGTSRTATTAFGREYTYAAPRMGNPQLVIHEHAPDSRKSSPRPR
jgi:hypothetical protein